MNADRKRYASRWLARDAAFSMTSGLHFVAGPFTALLRHRTLTLELARREVLGRYRGASFGLWWSLISPFLVLCIYTFAFGTVMGGRWPRVAEGADSFAIILFSGLIVHGFFAECITRAPTLVVGNPNFVKRVVFPLHVLPWPMVICALFHTLMNLVVFIVLRLLVDGAFAWTIVLLPLVLLPLVLLALGVSWMLASLGVYIRDIAQVSGVVSTALLFLSSAMMPLEAVPAAYRWVFLLNPLTFIIDQARSVMVWERMPDWAGLGLYTLVAVLVMYLGLAWFRRTRQGFADVL